MFISIELIFKYALMAMINGIYIYLTLLLLIILKPYKQWQMENKPDKNRNVNLHSIHLIQMIVVYTVLMLYKQR